MDYRSHFQSTIIKLQRQLDDSMFREDWGAYLELRHQMIAIKEHIIAHESVCGYECECKPEPEWSQIINNSITETNREIH